MKPRLYLETTIPSYLVARASRDAILHGQQAATRKWWEQRRGDYELFVSEFVDIEAGRGEAEMAAARAATLQGFAASGGHGRRPRTRRRDSPHRLDSRQSRRGRLAHRGGRRASDGYFADLELHAHP